MSEMKSIESLNALLANVTVFYQKLRHYHWNVIGARFLALHGQFEHEYDGWSEAIDEIAERIVQLGGVPAHTLEEVLGLATLAEDPEVPSAEGMIQRVVADLLALRSNLDDTISRAEGANDRVTAAMIDGYLAGVEKSLWMFGATLK